MSMSDHEFDADTHLLEAQKRGLGSRPRLRTIAVIAWISFMCGVAALMIFLFMIPEHLTQAIGLDWLSGFFITAWACGFATALITLFMVERIWSTPREKQ